ncbi:MAG: tRNA (guanosine(46)-N7)-methyltransferase TrmB [Bacteroidetes bacterium]|nr:tRNA (guanosine(46)-N7)-methyltransferase TrmB [Bacteroidota bacterium]
MTKKKLIHFRENLTFPHLFQPGYSEIEKDFHYSSCWKRDFFHNDNPIILELGCGKGEYTVGLAEKYPEKNFIGIDFKGARLWRGSKTVKEKELKNVAFIRTQVDHVIKFFGPGEISEIWITFPDPQPNKERKRLTAPVFLDRYRNLLGPDGIIHLKTDDLDFYTYTLKIIGQENHSTLFSTTDLYHSGFSEDVISIRTYYENRWLELGKNICYIKFKLNCT